MARKRSRPAVEARELREVAAYVRVSSDKQSTDSQEPDLLRWLAAHNVPGTWFSDTFTGETMARPGFEKMWAWVEAGEFDAILVWRIDRLGRTMVQQVPLYARLIELRVNLISIRESFDLFSPGGRLMLNFLTSIAEYENEVRRERVIAGQASARAAGKTWGGSPKGWRHRVNSVQWSEARRLKSEGASVAAIARLTQLSRTTVYSILADVAEPSTRKEMAVMSPRR